MLLRLERSFLLSGALFLNFSQAQSLPRVDLGYEVHQAYCYNSTSQIYKFTDIRYAQAPVGELRFALPQPPTVQTNIVQNGSVGVICPQIYDPRAELPAQFVAAYLAGQPFDFDEALATVLANNTSSVAPDPRMTEDCLFLDVSVPRRILNTAQRYRKRGYKKPGAAVLVWIHGGGYIQGEKAGFYDPNGLIEASRLGDSEGIIFVSINYRLGVFGWLSGPTLQSNGTANAGLHDQRLALEWIRQNIHFFGGDPNRVTVMGLSAGGGSIMHQIVAYGGAVPAPFQRAIIQSPGWEPLQTNSSTEALVQDFLVLLGVDTIEEARQLPSRTLMEANNALANQQAPYASFPLGPVIDGSFVPDSAGKLLLAGSFDKNVQVMAGHNSEEGIAFTDPRVNDDATLREHLRQRFISLTESDVNFIVSTLYPAIYDGSQPYRNGLERTILLIADVIFTCHTFHLAKAYDNQTYNYQFAVPPALHAYDVVYTFYNGLDVNLIDPDSSINGTVAVGLQEYLTNFAQSGRPSAGGLPEFPLYGDSAMEFIFNSSGLKVEMDPTANARCRYWQNAG